MYKFCLLLIQIFYRKFNELYTQGHANWLSVFWFWTFYSDFENYLQKSAISSSHSLFSFLLDIPSKQVVISKLLLLSMTYQLRNDVLQSNENMKEDRIKLPIGNFLYYYTLCGRLLKYNSVLCSNNFTVILHLNKKTKQKNPLYHITSKF